MVPLLPSSLAWYGLRIRPRRKEVTVPLPWRTPEVADTVFSTSDDGCMTPETCRVRWQRINVYILSHRVGPLLTLNHDARNHVFKIHSLFIVHPYCYSTLFLRELKQRKINYKEVNKYHNGCISMDMKLLCNQRTCCPTHCTFPYLWRLHGNPARNKVEFLGSTFKA